MLLMAPKGAAQVLEIALDFALWDDVGARFGQREKKRGFIFSSAASIFIYSEKKLSILAPSVL